MFDNIAQKIKKFTVVYFVIIMVMSVLASLFLISVGMDSYEETYTHLGITLLFVLPISNYINCFLIYGFAELIEKTCNIEKALCNTTNEETTNEETTNEETVVEKENITQ